MQTVELDFLRFHAGDALPPAEQRARNPAAASDNKIHEDTVAKQYGFRGGLVPGATTYAYLASYLTRMLGPMWPASGGSTVSLVRPVYENEIVRLGGTVTALEGDASRGSIAIECWADGPDGTRCAPATARLAWGEREAMEPVPAFVNAGLAARARDERPPISLATAPVGDTLPPVVADTDPDAMRAYLDEIADTNPLFREGSPFGGPLVHPGWWPSLANRVLSGNFLLGPWIHTRSEIRHLAPAIAGGIYHAHAQLVEAFEKRGHEYVSADVVITDSGDQPVVRMRHTAIVVVAQRDAATQG